MGETVAAIAPFVGVAAGVTSIVTGLSSAASAQEAAELQAQQLAEEREAARVQAVLDETEHRKELANVLASQRAVRAGRGVELFSETFRNIQDRTTEDAEADISVGRLNSLRRQRRLGLGMDQAQTQGRMGAMQGYGSAFSGFSRAVGSASEIGKEPKK
ncbi:MAG: hypothetical protein NBV67_02825 [Tagaea sp.]|nr:hypothetical protein [Tagaea sp.]